jgi:Zn-dependent protease
MPWSIRIGTVFGTAVRIHVTFLLLLAFIWIMHYRSGGAAAAWDGAMFILAVFACVLAHEFGHVLAARAFGIGTPDVTLFPIGGVANLSRLPEKPSQELLVALAGPAVNVVIAVGIISFLGATGDLDKMARLEDPASGMAQRLLGANIMMAVFNMLPAFPMDGGRVLRALLAMRLGFSRATIIAATIGQGFAFLLGFAGLFVSPMLVFIAIFVYLAASSEAGYVAMRDATRGMTAARGAMTTLVALSPQSPIGEAVDALLATSQKEFPVLAGDGAFIGLLTREAIIRALRQNGPDQPVGEVATDAVPKIGATMSLEDAAKLLGESNAPAVAVHDRAGRFVGLVTAENLAELLLIRKARPNLVEERPAWARG